MRAKIEPDEGAHWSEITEMGHRKDLLCGRQISALYATPLKKATVVYKYALVSLLAAYTMQGECSYRVQARQQRMDMPAFRQNRLV